jgi:hypothetical protein
MATGQFAMSMGVFLLANLNDRPLHQTHFIATSLPPHFGVVRHATCIGDRWLQGLLGTLMQYTDDSTLLLGDDEGWITVYFLGLGQRLTTL